MAAAPVTPNAILGRLFDPERIDLSPEAAASLLKLSFDQRDRDRMRELLVKNQDDSLSPDEKIELESYRQVASMVDLIQARARQALNRLSPVR